MSTASLTADAREKSGKGTARTLRREGRTPAVIYGHSREAQSLSLETRELERLLDRITTGSTVIELKLGSGRPVRTLIREVQRHPVKKRILHVDFQELVAGESVVTKVPLRFHGIPDGVRNGAGVLEEKMHEITVEADPSNLPDHIDVDVTDLGLAKSLHVSDIALPPGLSVMDEGDITIATVQPPRVAEAVEETAEAEAPAAGEPELIRKPKDEDEE